MEHTAYIGLGSNLGDRRRNLDGALAELDRREDIRVVARSSYHETEPVGGPPGQGMYLNGAAALRTNLSPEGLLQALLEVEQLFGRVRREPNGPRTLDLDLLLYDDLVRVDAPPLVPHPRMAKRRFVLEPLSEIAGHVRHPVLGVTISRLVEALKPEPPPDRPLAGLRALVTGSTSGIGRAIAEQFARAGAWVVVHGRRHPEQAQELATQLRQYDVATAWLMADLRQTGEVSALADQAWRLWEGLDVLVCNAGADILTGDLAAGTFEQKLDALWQVDVCSTVRIARDIGTRMKEQGRGVIVTMGWDQAETGMEGDSGQLFACVKNAVMGFTRSLAMSLAPEVRVNCVAPGWIQTAWGQGASDEWQQRVLRETPLRRWGHPEDVAGVVTWLVSPMARFLTGQVIRVNGGAVR
jgi:2-amino-4-hydroxy-6-hydroxymethyldihydropteridine diphosphokinase